MIVVYFIFKIVSDNKIYCENCYNNCMYNCEKTRQVLVFNTYDVTTRLDIMYIGIIEYSNILFLSKCQRLLIGNPPRETRTVAE